MWKNDDKAGIYHSGLKTAFIASWFCLIPIAFILFQSKIENDTLFDLLLGLVISILIIEIIIQVNTIYLIKYIPLIDDLLHMMDFDVIDESRDYWIDRYKSMIFDTVEPILHAREKNEEIVDSFYYKYGEDQYAHFLYEFFEKEMTIHRNELESLYTEYRRTIYHMSLARKESFGDERWAADMVFILGKFKDFKRFTIVYYLKAAWNYEENQ